MQATARDKLAAAIEDYSSKGWLLFLLASGSKVPRAGSRGKDDATANVEDLHGQLDARANGACPNLGGLPPEGCAYLDVDRKDGKDGAETLRRKLATVASPEFLDDPVGWLRERYPTQRTATGTWHFLMRFPSGKRPRRKPWGDRGGIEFGFAPKFYMVLEPSVTPAGAYVWEDDLPFPEDIPDAPDFLIPLVLEREPAAKPQQVPQTQRSRHDEMLFFALDRAREGCDEDTIYEMLVAWRAARGWLDKPLDELRRLASWAVAHVQPREDEARTDLGNARRLARLLAGVLRHTEEWGWVVYDGQRWVVRAERQALALAAEVLARLLPEALVLVGEEKEAAIKWAIKSQSARAVRDALALAAALPELRADADDFDQDPFVLNVRNGTLDLRTATLRPHRAADLLTKITAAPFDPEATAPKWNKLLERVLPDDDVRAFVHRLFGYALTGSTEEQIFAFLYGAGANGKTTVVEPFQGALGDYAATASFDTFLARRAGAATNDLARLKAARLVVASEPNENARLDEAIVKQLTGGDPVSARFHYREFFEYKPAFTLVMYGNHRPQIRGTDLGIWRRVALIPFEVTIPEAERERDLAAQIRGEWPGVLAWAVRGCVDWWQREGLKMPAAVRVATAEYRRDEDRLGDFLDDCCEVADGLRVATKRLRQAYVTWCEDNGERPLSAKAFGSRLRERGFEPYRHGRVRGYQGLAVAGGDA